MQIDTPFLEDTVGRSDGIAHSHVGGTAQHPTSSHPHAPIGADRLLVPTQIGFFGGFEKAGFIEAWSVFNDQHPTPLPC